MRFGSRSLYREFKNVMTMPKKEENVNYLTVKSHTLRIGDQYNLLEETSVKQIMATTLWAGRDKA